MVITELNKDGAEKYVVSLRGPLDGMRFDVLYLPDGEMVAKLIDEKDSHEVEALKMKTEIYETNEGFTGLKVMSVGNNSRGVVLVWDEEVEPLTNRYERGTKLELTGLGYTDELYYLTAWWLIQNRTMEVNVNDWIRIRKGDAGLQSLESLFLGESQMEAFYGGDEVALSDGLTLKVDCDKRPDDSFDLAVSIRDEEDMLAWIEGVVTRNREGVYQLVVDEWVNNWEGDDRNIELDLLAFCSRYMEFKFFDYEIFNQGFEVELNQQAISERTAFWLGF